MLPAPVLYELTANAKPGLSAAMLRGEMCSSYLYVSVYIFP